MRDPNRQPYVGPRPFEGVDQGLFFGREREAEDLLSLIMFHRTVLLYAQSGAGKSSLINTSIFPGLRDAGFAVLPVARVRGALPVGLHAAIRNVYVFNALYGIDGGGPERDLNALAALEMKNFLRGRSIQANAQGLVLIFDQFEELFTAHQDRWSDREHFFKQIADALEVIDSLRVVFSMREDFIAEIDPFVWHLPDGINVRYRLELLRHEAAIRAVTEPARVCGTTVEATAAEQLVGHLQEVNVEGPGGRPQRVKGEYVEPVQLQIVCSRLWERLPRDVDVITETHLHQFGDVADALAAFYEAAVAEAARATQYPEKLIHLGCTQFVTSSGTRGMVHRDEQATGLLPNPVIDSLVDQHLLRAESKAGARWYEISHDRLIEPILQKKLNDEELKQLLHATDLLAAAVEQWEARRDFVSDKHILRAISEVKGELRLSERELEFLSMNSIGAGFEIEAWVERLKREAPDLLNRILGGASRHPQADVRRNATSALGVGGVGDAEEGLIRLAINDPDPEVREVAALNLGRVDRPVLNEAIFALLREKTQRERAVTALARMRNERATGSPPGDLEARWRAISWWDRGVLGLAITGVRLQKAWPSLVYVATFGGIVTGLFVGLGRLVPSMWGFTLSQVPEGGLRSPVLGMFQGGFGGLYWGGFTAGFMVLGWILLRRDGSGAMSPRNVGNVILGTLGSVLGGITTAGLGFATYETESLMRVGWLPRAGPPTLWACVAVTRYCLIHPLLGIPFGVGAGLAISALHTLPYWNRFIAPHAREGRIVQWWGTLRQILYLSTMLSIPTIAMFCGMGIVFVFWLKFNVYRAVPEVTSILAGSIGVVAGMMLGQLIMRVGITIPPRSD